MSGVLPKVAVYDYKPFKFKAKLSISGLFNKTNVFSEKSENKTIQQFSIQNVKLEPECSDMKTYREERKKKEAMSLTNFHYAKNSIQSQKD